MSYDTFLETQHLKEKVAHVDKINQLCGSSVIEKLFVKFWDSEISTQVPLLKNKYGWHRGVPETHVENQQLSTFIVQIASKQLDHF